MCQPQEGRGTCVGHREFRKKEFRQQNPDTKHLRRDDGKLPCGTPNSSLLTSSSQALAIPLLTLRLDRTVTKQLTKLSSSKRRLGSFHPLRHQHCFPPPEIKVCYLFTNTAPLQSCFSLLQLLIFNICPDYLHQTQRPCFVFCFSSWLLSFVFPFAVLLWEEKSRPKEIVELVRTHRKHFL